MERWSGEEILSEEKGKKVEAESNGGTTRKVGDGKMEEREGMVCKPCEGGRKGGEREGEGYTEKYTKAIRFVGPYESIVTWLAGTDSTILSNNHTFIIILYV